MSDELKSLIQLENKIQTLIHLHNTAKGVIFKLNESNKSLSNQLETEKQKVRKMEKEMEAEKVTKAIHRNETIGVLKTKVDHILREIDNDIAVMNHKSRK